jgi:hypothetical protein
MSTLKNLLAGLGGAVALNILHESLKRAGDMPRIDLVGEEALQKGLRHFGTEIKDDDALYGATLGADLVSNALYYSAIGAGSRKHIWGRAVVLGLSAGIGAVALPEHMGLNAKPVAHNKKVKALTIGYYLAGALVTAALAKKLEKNGRMLW